jgi:hypothetical protein
MLHLDCSDSKQIHVTREDFQTINDLLNTKICPENVTLVENLSIPGTEIHQVGLCPFELAINYEGGRKPEVIVEAKCTKCLGMKCSTLSKCKEIRAEMEVKDTKGEIKIIRRSIGCFCTPSESKQGKAEKPPE